MKWCTECGKECDVLEIIEELDYEYWGAHGTHKSVYEVSVCCDADMVDDEEEIEKLFPYEDEPTKGESK